MGIRNSTHDKMRNVYNILVEIILCLFGDHTLCKQKGEDKIFSVDISQVRKLLLSF
jgi:hypothetical protein